jgi:hypothetical protein
MSIRLKDTIYNLVDKSTKDGSGNTITSTYLKLSGGTISSSSYGPLTIKRSGSSNMAAIKFENDSGVLGSIGMNTVNGNLMKYNSDTSSSNTILDSGNYSTWVAAKEHTHSYLPLSGGTLTGNLTLKVDSGDSPYLMFQRGDINHSSTFDWKIFCTGGNLVFQHDSGAWTTAFQLNYTDSSAMINGNTVLHAGNYTSYAATAGHTHNYAGSNSAGGPANSVVCSSASSDTSRPILVTNESNGLCYTSKVKLNYSTGTIFANQFAITGSGKTDTLLTSDNEHNVYFSIAGSVPFVINNSEKSVRPGISYNNQYSLGTSSSKWSNVYATTFNGNATSATKATQDGSGNVITSTYLKLTGGTLTGDLILNAGNEDRFLKFQYNNGDTYGWRIGYLGSGSGDANYLVIQTSQETAATWTNALRFGNTKGDALFSASVTANGGFIGALTGNVTGNVSGSSGSCTGNAASATKLATARTLWGQSFNGTANVSGNMTGVGSISMSNTLVLTGTDSTSAAISFSRASYNYIHAPASGLICLQPNGMGATSAAGYHFNGTEFFPAANNTYTLGTSSKKWKNVYATTFTGALSGNATSSSSCSGNSATATLASTVTCSATSSNNDRPIVGTPGNNNLYYTTLATVNWSTGKIICGGLQSKDITLYSASGDSPHLIFQRGGLYDGTYDWDVFVTGGTLKFRVNKSSSTAASYTDILKMYNDDDTIRSSWPIYASTFRNSSGTEVSYSGHTHSAYYDSTISRTANTVLAAPNGSAGTASFRKLVAADIPTLAISKISGLQSALDGKSATHSHPYAGSSTQGGAATSALTISASAPQLAAAGESNNINIVNNANSSITTNSPESLAAITKAIRFRWYNDYWEIGSIRGSSDKSIGFGFTINNNNLRFRITSDAAYVGSSTVLHTGNWSSYCAAKSHNHSGVLDSGNSTFTTFAYSKAGLNYSDYTWLAGWNGYELRAINKSQFAQASHTHDYAASNHSHSGYMTTSSPTGSGTLMMNGSNSRGSYPAVKWHISNVNWAQIVMNGSGELEFRGGGAQDASYITARMGACVCTSLYVGGEQITFTT